MMKMKMIETVIVTVVKRHVTKNVGSRAKIKIFEDVIVKRHVKKNVGSRAKIKIFEDAIMKRYVMKNMGSKLKDEILRNVVVKKDAGRTWDRGERPIYSKMRS